MASISVRNNTNTSFYRRHGRRSSLLIHPDGLKLLEFYANEKKSPTSARSAEFANELAWSLEQVVRGKEVTISTALRKVLKDSWEKYGDGNFSVTGEKEESVEGQLSQTLTSGDPVANIRMTPFGLSGQVDQQKLVMLIIEVSVDKNGGEKKVGQEAFDYASLSDHPNEIVLLFTLNVDRSQKDGLKITQEAFMYLHRDEALERKMGFLWREVYQAGSESDLEFLKTTCGGIVRCLNCAEYLRTISFSIKPKNWEVVSDNVAIEDELHVFKIFDNRFHPTYRRPDVWLENHQPWIAELEVEKYIEFNEATSIDVLGKPTRKRPNGEDDPETVPYPRGSILVIKYKFINGTHFASRASHFQAISRCISAMHEAGIVHADIRGFNMLHPHPVPVDGGIKSSRLIDFDLCGTPGKDKYPPGYASDVRDNCFSRSGRPGSIMQEIDDWRDLASAMAHYKIYDDKTIRKAWEGLWSLFRSNRNQENAVDFAASIDAFIAEHGDVEIELDAAQRMVWEDAVLLKGTGSPNKKKLKSRGSTTIDPY
jgi:hypothetical protein